LLIGLIIYLLFKPHSYISELIYNLLGSSLYIHTDSAFAEILRNYLCDILWAYSLIFVIDYLCECNFLLEIIFAWIFEVVMEVIQIYPIIPGTFDILDIILEVSTTVVGVCIIIFYNKKGEKRK
jgi:glycopeptide antibiotics resistance protein